MIQSIYKHIATPILDFIYPPLCTTCDQRLNDGERLICSRCWSTFPEIHQEHATFIEHRERFVRDGVVQDLLSAFLFEQEGVLQQALHLLKYQGIKSLGIRLGKEVGVRIAANSRFASADALIPVPLHKLKERERGYNQSVLICKGISEVTHIPVKSSLIKRKKYTQSQTHLNLEQRKENVGDAFDINPEFQSEVTGKTIILVDDVITTGSTVNACARELQKKGAATILAASVAIA